MEALIAQSVEHATFNRGVGDSSSPQGFLLFLLLHHRRLYSGIITDCGSVDPGSIPGRRIVSLSDMV